MIYKTIALPQEVVIQEVFRHIANDEERTAAIAAEVVNAFNLGRKVLVLAERTDHLDAILAALDGKLLSPFVLHGRMSKKQRANVIKELDELLLDAPRVLLATGKLVGEGFPSSIGYTGVGYANILERNVTTVCRSFTP